MNVNISAIAIQVLEENRSIYIQYPGNPKNQAAAYYQYGEEIGVGLAPGFNGDKKSATNHTLAMMHEGHYTVPLGIAVQNCPGC